MRIDNMNSAFLLILLMLFLLFSISAATGGNQRDLARQKAQKKQADAKKGARTDNLTLEQRKAK